MTSNGPPIPKGVGGPTPPLVSQRSDVQVETRILTGGSPSLDGRGDPTSPPLGRGEEPAPTKGRGGLFRNREADEEPPPTQRGREDPILTQGGAHDPPPTREGREKNQEEKMESQQDQPEKST